MLSDKKKVLIITYYWPPSGGSGVQRWVKFAKYLRNFNWEPVIFTPENPERPAIDDSLLNDIPEDLEIIKTPIWEPYSFYKKFVGLKKDEKLGSGLMKSGNESGMLQKLSVWIRGNFFIPDARKFWIKPSQKFLNNYLSKNKIDAIVSSGPPHSMHLIAQKVSQKNRIPWLADFRDPWTNIDFFEDLSLTSLARKKHHSLEKKTLDSADKVIVVSPTMKKEFEVISDTPISVITNGFDTDDFESSALPNNDKFSVSHIGMMTPTRNPEILWECIKELKDESEEFSSKFYLQLIGKVDAQIKEDVSKNGLEDQVHFIDYVPHKKVIEYQQNSDALLLIVNNTPNASLILTGKFFEYLAAKRPIICISPVKGDMNEILNETQSGELFLYSEKDQLKQHLKDLFQKWKEQNLIIDSQNSAKYSRLSLTEQLAEELNTISNE